MGKSRKKIIVQTPAALMDFAVVQAPSVNNASSCFTVGTNLAGNLLYVHFESIITVDLTFKLDLWIWPEGYGL